MKHAFLLILGFGLAKPALSAETLQIDKVSYSTKEILDGGKLLIEAIVKPANKLEPKDCWGSFTSDDLQRVDLPFDSCKPTKIEEGTYKLVLERTFPQVTVNRFYYIQSLSLRMKGQQVAEYGVPKTFEVFSAKSSKRLGKASGLAAWVNKGSAEISVKVEEEFVLSLHAYSDFPIESARLNFRIDVGSGLQKASYPISPGQTPDEWITKVEQDQEQGQASVGVHMKIPKDYDSTKEIRLEEVELINSALQEVVFRFPNSIKVTVIPQ